MNKIAIIFSVPVLILLTLGMTPSVGGTMNSQNHYKTLNEIPVNAWEKLAQKRIYFGHQSVGFDIMDGVLDIIQENSEIHLNIIETTDMVNSQNGIFAHSRVGENTDYVSKIRDFKKTIDEQIGYKPDMAFLKFCYVDVTGKTDIQAMFEQYKQEMNEIQKQHPDTTIIHFTIPLTIAKITWKTRLKIFFGKDDIWEYTDNLKRNQLNRLIKKEYQGKQPVFDLADIEATYPDGTKEIYTYKGDTYLALVPEYTYDGGHLNKIGQKRVAIQLLKFLINID